jgi:hypothetical protein
MQVQTSTFAPVSQVLDTLPLPKINVPPVHLLSATREYLETTITAISAQVVPSQQTTSAGVSFVPQASDTRDVGFTLAVISLIVCVNIGLAWLLGSSTGTAINGGLAVVEDTIHLHPITSESSPSRKEMLSDILKSSE